MIKADYRDCVELADQICESIEKADGSWVYEGDDLPGQIVPHLQPLVGELQALQALVMEAADYFADRPAPSRDWWRRYYLTTGDHMICTKEGWESGENKASYDPAAIVDEVNSPSAG